MLAMMRCSLPILCVFLLALWPARAAEPSFADLMARAQAQAAAGHRWDPPGDNFAETVVTLFGRLPTATPEQIAEFTALVEHDQKAMREQPNQLGSTPPAPESTLTGVAPPQVAAVPPTTPAAVSTQIQTRAEPQPETLNPSPTPHLALARAPAQVPPPRSAQPAVRPSLSVGASPDAHAVDLYGRGQAAEKLGDISGARRFYAAAAQHGHAAAARSLGRLYDSDYLRLNSIGGIDADAAIARQWYERATALGDPEAGPLLQALTAR